MDTTHGPARKRLKISRGGVKASPSPSTSATASNSASAVAVNGGASSSSTHAHASGDPCQHEAALKTLHTDIDAMRHLITCQICHRFMYEPYALSCGHTYCYSCLTQWLGSTRKKTCPDCRASISQQPTPSYILREMVLIFSSRVQLLPDGETSEEHDKLAKEEAQLVAKDKANTNPRNGGLFKGNFKHDGGLRLVPIYDAEDGVGRCPTCHWEVEDGFCNHCGVPVRDSLSDFSDDSELSDEELDHEIDEYDGNGEFGEVDDFEAANGHPQLVHISDDIDSDGGRMSPATFEAAFGGPPLPARLAGNRRRRGPSFSPTAITVGSEGDDGESDEDDDEDGGSEMDDFIEHDTEPAINHSYAFSEEDEEDDDVDDEDEDEGTIRDVSNRSRRRGHAHVVISDDEEEEGSTQAGAIAVDDDSDDEAPVLGDGRRTKRNRAVPHQRPVAISSDEDSEEDSEEEQYVPTAIHSSFSPLQGGSDDESAATAPSLHYNQSDAGSEASHMHTFGAVGDDEDEEEESDSDDESGTGYGHATRADFLPPSLRDGRNSLQTLGQHSNRFLNVSRRRYPPLSYPTAINRLGSLFGVNERAPEVRPPQHNHPFQLDNTLAGIQRRMQSGPPRTSRRVTSGPSSQGSADGGVEVRPDSQSSSGSSHTLSPSDAVDERPKRRMAPLAPVDYERAGRVYSYRGFDLDGEVDF